MAVQPARAQSVRLVPGTSASGPVRPCGVMERCMAAAGRAATAAAMGAGHGLTAVVTNTSAEAASAVTSPTWRGTMERLFQFA